MIDLKSIKPNKVSTNYNKHSMYLMGVPKSGKTTTMFDILGQDALFIELEDGAEAIPGINFIRCYNFADIKEVVWQLQDMVEAGECPFKSVVFDTTDMLEVFISKSVCSQAGVNEIGEIPHGKGYAQIDKVLLNLINDIKLRKVQTSNKQFICY